jgi:hypothetical protein
MTGRRKFVWVTLLMVAMLSAGKAVFAQRPSGRVSLWLIEASVLEASTVLGTQRKMRGSNASHLRQS